MLLLIVSISFGQGSGNKDSVKLSKTQFITALKKDDSLQVMKCEVRELRNQVDTLKSAYTVADSIGKLYKQADQKSQEINAAMKLEIARKDIKYDLSQVYNQALLKTIKRKNRTIALITGISITVSGTLTYLLLK